MESARVEMSVGGDLLNGSHVANGVAVNGGATSVASNIGEPQRSNDGTLALTNGNPGKDVVLDSGTSLPGSTDGLLNMISTEFYLPMATLVSRSAQECWNDILEMVERMAKIPILAQNTAAGMPQTNDQTRSNLDKKDELLCFANKHKAVFIKLLVLLQWSKRGEDVRKTIELNFWLGQRRAAFTEATLMVGRMMQDLASSQIPNPDLETAAEVLALGKVSQMPDLGYLPQSPMSAKQALAVLKRLNGLLNLRLALDTDIPEQMRNYRVHDGRVTFSVPGEFEVDLSVISEAADAHFLFVDFRFLLAPQPAIPDSFQDEISFVVNSAIEKDGLLGAYSFLHDLTLSYRLTELYKQARELSQGSWAGHMKVDLLRRTLVVQYWCKRSGPRSWVEIGAHSGKESERTHDSTSEESQLRIRWLRDGKLHALQNAQIDCLQLSMEQTLLHVIALHTSLTFDNIYDRFLLSPMYVDGELEIEQSTDLDNPAACFLNIQLSKHDHLNAQLEPITGAFILSPASERTEKVQSDLSKSKHPVEDFVSRISGLRAMLVEMQILRAMSNSGWQHLPGLKLSSQEMENLFSQPVIRSSFYRQNHWVSGWMLAATQSIRGDHWWLTRRSDTGLLESRLTQMIKSKPLHLEGSLSQAYLARLADYTSGTIVLQTNAELLVANGTPYRLPAIPRFSESYKLPPLRFEPVSALDNAAKDSCLQKEVEFSYHGFDQISGKTITIARANFTSIASNLKELAASHLDHFVSISPRSRQVMIRNVSDTGSIAIEELVSKLRHVDNIVACAATVRKSTHHSLHSLSLSAITITYRSDSDRQDMLVIHFATAEHGLQIEFLPANDNPHQHMAIFVARMLKRTGQSLSKNLEDVLALLNMTQPLITYLDSIQRGNLSDTTSTEKFDNGDLVIVHVLPRQAASYAVHYFSKSDGFPRDVTDNETPRNLLARLEILPQHRGQKTLWVVRPAIEESNAYTRPSYTSQALRQKLQEEVFGKKNPDWLQLGEGAAVSSEKPEKLLSRIHGCIVAWLASSLTTTAPKNLPNGVNGTVKPTSAQQQQRQQANSKQAGRANGASSSAQHLTQTSANSTKVLNNKKQEVITLD